MDPSQSSPAGFDRMEQFYFDRGSDCLIDLCPMADVGIIEEITRRGYQIIEFNNVMGARCSSTMPATRRRRLSMCGQSNRRIRRSGVTPSPAASLASTIRPRR